MRLIDIEKGGMMAGVKDEKLLHDYFCAKYNTENFLSVWGFMDGYLDVENSSELGAYFLKSMHMYSKLRFGVDFVIDVYSNFATRLLVAGGPGQADSRKELLEFYDTMTTKSEYDAVDKSCFAAFDEKGMKQKDSKKKVRKLLPANDTRYHVSGPPPPKAAPSPPPPVASL